MSHVGLSLKRKGLTKSLLVSPFSINIALFSLLFLCPGVLQNTYHHNYWQHTKDCNMLINTTSKKNKHYVDNKECYGMNNTQAL